MKYILLLSLISCASNQEPWKKGDCVEYTPRSTFYKIVDKPLYLDNRRLGHKEWFYSLTIIKTNKRPDKVLKKISCEAL